ncbi:MFS transporter [Streptomyces camponoticapitis]|uniref:MFS transporter n=1 Tax=Streptomyces camponoticapitis TaxID=1616125 RepID=A0ABQ2E617_9ACTN|nr:MFS transporter [Streptomyces camponoticapitis]GGJ95674.1 MFS transporter [Streptomyces camponoticapitis]
MSAHPAVSPPAISASAPERPAHRDANVLRWLAAYTVSMVGDSLYYMALAWAAARSGDPTRAGLVLAVGAVPRAVLMLGGGVLADRWGPRRVVIGSDAARCVVILAIAAVLLLGAPGLWLLIAVALVFGVVDALFLPAVGALPPRITASGQLARVQGLRGLAARVANVTGAPLGGLLVAFGGSAAAFAAAGALFAVSLVLLVAVRVAPLPTDTAGHAGPSRAGARGELTDGLRHIRRHRVLAPLMLVIALSELGFVGPLNLGLVLLAQDRGWGAGGMGWIVAAFGVGAGAASLLLAVRGRLPRAGLVLCLSVVTGAFAVGAIAFVPTVALAAVAGLFVGLLAGLGGGLCGALTQTVTEPAYLGRVTSVATLFTLGIAPLSYPVTGAAVGLWGTGPVFVVSAAVCAAGGALGLAFAGLRRAELPGGRAAPADPAA